MADARAHGVALHRPLKSVTNAQARAGTYGQDAFTVDWDSKRVTCPNGITNTGWREDRSQQGLPVVRAQFSARDCQPCPVVGDCVPNLSAKGRAITLRPQQAHRELQQARALQQADEWKERYKVRAGIEGTHKACTAVTCVDHATAA
ncbi:transposase [Streptomyces sp. NPDC002701]|uniref:transposase n=1 Tax=Streptomyces sp. NPDC002701 TaxID=3364661 RepID=UPI00367E8469